MPDMRDVLHDEIDSVEELVEKASDVIETKRSRMEEIIRGVLASEELDSTQRLSALPEVLELIAVEVEAELAGLTTEAFQKGAEFQRIRYRTIK